MSLNRWDKKRDANDLPLQVYAKSRGCEIIPHDKYDWELLTPDRRNLMVEIKTKTGRLTKSQQKYLLDGWPLRIVRCEADIDELIDEVEFTA